MDRIAQALAHLLVAVETGRRPNGVSSASADEEFLALPARRCY
jgi:hypothetical protein